MDVAVFAPGERDVRLAASLGIGPTDVTVGYITSMTPYEAIDQLIDAVALLVRAGCPVKGLLVGDGTQRRSLEDRCRRLGIADHVVFTGQVPHNRVPAYYRLLDVFVVPRSAARVCELVTPLKPYEAMATARPVVVSNVAALREMVIDGETGIVYHGASGGLAEVIDSLIAAPGERERLGRNARAWVSEHRTWRENAEKYLRSLPAPGRGMIRRAGRSGRALVAGSMVVILVTGCGGDDDSATRSGGPPTTTKAPTLLIERPTDGATLDCPVIIRVMSTGLSLLPVRPDVADAESNARGRPSVQLFGVCGYRPRHSPGSSRVAPASWSSNGPGFG